MSKNSQGIIKSLVYSDRNITPKNMKYDLLKEVLKSEELDSIIENKNGEMKKILIYYKDKINNDKSLKGFDYYLDKVNTVRAKRLNTIMNGNVNKVVHNRLKDMYRNEEIEDEIRDRGVKHFKVRNESLEVNITVLTDLEYQLQMFRLDTIYNIITTYEKIKSTELFIWYENIKKYTQTAYGHLPIKSKGKIYLGKDHLKEEEILLYHCLTNDHIYCVKRVKMNF
ncbi:hypothetical protein [Alkaliphilus sp. B6464]|uniref:hypothetical protein n=1 Tax=Alkaliphilus sp. B6464 TaxID=2731219 RepID=UPI001BAC23B0|nr:hypothetical protein [Alkaliphilus sp. B6464]QUH21956.1 hypothetical protein HYG84_18795 [Alkaliphilus sp. B6464]